MKLEIPLDTINALLEQLPTHRLQVVLDPAPAHELDALTTSRLALITPNETELETFLPTRRSRCVSPSRGQSARSPGDKTSKPLSRPIS